MPRLTPPVTRAPRGFARPALTLALAAVLLAASGCTQGPPPSLDAAYGAFNAGELKAAYAQAVAVAKDPLNPDHDEAAYLAGRSAKQLDKPRDAAVWLTRAAQGNDPAIRGEAAVALGTLYAEQGDHQRAADTFLYAADHLPGDDRARATYFAARSQQRLGQWASARTNLILARAYAQDPALRQRANDQLAVTGYTIQTGAFLDDQRAQEAALSIAPNAEELGLGAPRLVPAMVEGRPVTLVHLGEFSTYLSAQAFRQRLGVEAVIAPIAPVE